MNIGSQISFSFLAILRKQLLWRSKSQLGTSEKGGQQRKNNQFLRCLTVAFAHCVPGCSFSLLCNVEIEDRPQEVRSLSVQLYTLVTNKSFQSILRLVPLVERILFCKTSSAAELGLKFLH